MTYPKAGSISHRILARMRLRIFACWVLGLVGFAMAVSTWEPIPVEASLPTLVPYRSQYPNLIPNATFGWAAHSDSQLILGNPNGEPIIRPIPDFIFHERPPSQGWYRQFEAHRGNIRIGNWSTKDGGLTWDSLFNDRSHLSTVWTDSYWVAAGGGYDVIERSSDSGKTWRQVHFGRTYGTISHFLPISQSNLFAFPAYDSFLSSQDSGLTWRHWDSLFTDSDLSRIVEASALPWRDSPLAGTTGYLVLATRNHTSPRRLALANPNKYELTLLNSQLPDSIVTALVWGPNENGWMSTIGQGIWHSTDLGKTWQPFNDGLPSLRVTGLILTKENELVALTQAGLAIRRDAVPGMTPTPIVRLSPEASPPANRSLRSTLTILNLGWLLGRSRLP